MSHFVFKFFCLQTNCKHFAIFSTFLNFSKLLKPLFYGLFTTTVLVFLTWATRTLYSHIICIICIYNITCISGFSRLGNIYIICIIRTIYIINISLLWTNCGHRPHPFTAIIIPYFKIQWIVRIKKSYIWQDMDSSLVFVYNYILNIRISQNYWELILYSIILFIVSDFDILSNNSVAYFLELSVLEI